MLSALIIDDDEMDLELFRAVLEEEGYRVFATADGPQGLMLYEHHRPAVVFLDLGLPTVSGIDILRELRERDPGAQVILITGYASEESAAAAREFGALDHLEKSWDTGIMIGRIRASLRAVAPRGPNSPSF